MKFLLDECVGPTVERWLAERRYDARSIQSYKLQGSDDEAVLKKAFDENRILITCDKDFGDIVFRGRGMHCGVVLLRLINERPSNKIAIIDEVLKKHEHELDSNFVVAAPGSIRVIKIIMA